MSETEDYEYAYSSDEDGVDDPHDDDDDGSKNDEDCPDDAAPESDVDDDDSQGGGGGLKSSNRSFMDWETSNPNAPPTMIARHSQGHRPLGAGGGSKSGIRFLNSQDLFPELHKRIRELAEVLGLTSAAASVLLREYSYSKERVLEQYTLDTDAVLNKCGVYHRVAKPVVVATKNATGAETTCPICYDDVSSTLAMPCGHAFCLECWCDFCTNAVKEGPSCASTTCPQAGCSERVTEDEFAAALGGNVVPLDTDASPPPVGSPSRATSLKQPPLWIKYNEFLLRNFVESNPLTRWCPGLGCERVACAESAAAMEGENNVAHCTGCTSRFCMLCGSEPHAPVPCRDLRKWTEKCRNESETANWILANTKSCPKCYSRIEKNQGCNHMTCQRCKFEFCWICMGDWNDHGANTGGYYKCSRYRDSEEATSDSARAKRELDRYLHYYRRYHAHQEAETFARRQLQETEMRMVALQEASSGDSKWTDVEFLKAANVQLVECRRVLKYTYVFAYYLPTTQTAARDRFEHHQEMLERFTENLSELSEKPISDMDRTDVVNQTRVVDRFMKNVLKYVEDGMEED